VIAALLQRALVSPSRYSQWSDDKLRAELGERVMRLIRDVSQPLPQLRATFASLEPEARLIVAVTWLEVITDELKRWPQGPEWVWRTPPAQLGCAYRAGILRTHLNLLPEALATKFRARDERLRQRGWAGAVTDAELDHCKRHTRCYKVVPAQVAELLGNYAPANVPSWATALTTSTGADDASAAAPLTPTQLHLVLDADGAVWRATHAHPCGRAIVVEACLLAR
jgi:hypothetical protein